MDGFKSPKSQGILVKIGILQRPLIGVEFELDIVKYLLKFLKENVIFQTQRDSNSSLH